MHHPFHISEPLYTPNFCMNSLHDSIASFPLFFILNFAFSWMSSMTPENSCIMCFMLHCHRTSISSLTIAFLSFPKPYIPYDRDLSLNHHFILKHLAQCLAQRVFNTYQRREQLILSLYEQLLVVRTV